MTYEEIEAAIQSTITAVQETVDTDIEVSQDYREGFTDGTEALAAALLAVLRG